MPVPVRIRPPRPNAAVRGTVDRAVLKTAAPSWARGRANRPGRTNFIGEWWNAYTRVSETRGRKLVQVRILSRRPNFDALSSNENRSPASQAGNAGAGGQQADRHAAGVGRSSERVSASHSRRGDHFPPRSSKRTVRLINGIALDQRPARERYPARRPVCPLDVGSDVPTL